jgi:hypothetical protein
MSKEFCLIAMSALLTVGSGANATWADEPTPPAAPVVSVPAKTLPPAKETPPLESHVSWRDRLFHRPLLFHAKAPCPGCSFGDDPDMGCGTCHSEWVFLFGSCHAFYNEPFYYSPFGR